MHVSIFEACKRQVLERRNNVIVLGERVVVVIERRPRIFTLPTNYTALTRMRDLCEIGAMPASDLLRTETQHF